MNRQSDVSDDEFERLERLLIESAKLDSPDEPARRRVVAAGLDLLQRRSRARSYRALAFVGAAVSAAGLAFSLSRHGELPIAREQPPLAIALSERPPLDHAKAPPACPELVVARGDAPLIEDWEKVDSMILGLDGRSGSWVTYDDGTGHQRPGARSPLLPTINDGPRPPSKHGLHISGSRFIRWGVTFGAELADGACYDASAYAGLQFWAKGPARLRVGFQTIDVQSVKYGGFCKKGCYHAHLREIEVTPAWRPYEIRWSELRQLAETPPAGEPEPYDRIAFDPARVRFLDFSIGAENTPFDLWVDDVSFLTR